jgi:hypothetical protein
METAPVLSDWRLLWLRVLLRVLWLRVLQQV